MVWSGVAFHGDIAISRGSDVTTVPYPTHLHTPHTPPACRGHSTNGLLDPILKEKMSRVFKFDF